MSFDIAIAKTIGESRIDLRIETDDPIIGIVGPSGIGKTTLLNCIAGLSRPDGGHVRIAGRTLFDAADGTDLPPEQRRGGYAFQDCRLFPHMDVRQNLAFGPRRASGEQGVPSFAEIAARLGLFALLDRKPRNLSGGESRRVALGRAVLSAPDFLLLDEPLSSLDPERAGEVLGMIADVCRSGSIPAIVVSHHRGDIARLTRRVVELPDSR